MKTTVTICDGCGQLRVSIPAKTMRAVTVPGTGDAHCDHVARLAASQDVPALVHLALSSVINDPGATVPEKDMCHVVQRWLAVPDRDRRISSLGYVFLDPADTYRVSSEGLAVARILARSMAKIAEPGDAFYWLAAANVMRRRLS